MKRRFANGTVIASAMGLFCACTVVIGDLPEGSSNVATGGDGGTAGSALGGGAGVATGGLAGVAGTSSGGAGGVGGSAGATGGSAGMAGTGGSACINGECDCDGDTYLAEGGTCQGNDCNDADERAHPDQQDYFSSASKVIGDFDFNCDGVPTPKFKLVNCGVGLLVCPTPPGDGYANPVPSCGETAMFIVCAKSGAVCVQQNSSPLPMPCR